MAIKPPADMRSMVIDKRHLREKVLALMERMGEKLDTTATAEKSRELMLAQGIRPEDRILSSEIIRARYEDEEK